MLSTRTGSVSTNAGAGELAAYYATEQTMAELLWPPRGGPP